MKLFSLSKRFALVAAALSMVSLAGLAEAPAAVTQAKDFIQNMNKGNFQSAHAELASDLSQKVGADKLQNAWDHLIQKAGSFVDFHDHKVDQKGAYTIVTQVCQFKKGAVDILVAVDNSGKVADFRYQNHKPAKSTQAEKTSTDSGRKAG
ncbi:MAG: DUF3887 domain-containing protein [Acidobacteriota bacterium]|jgi:hypothetical protein